MSKLTNRHIRRIIMQELASMVGEDALIKKDNPQDSHITGIERGGDYSLGEKSTCSECGSDMVFEDECMECGHNSKSMIYEGCGCGCNGAPGGCRDKSNEDKLLGLDTVSMNVDFPNKHNNYMTRPQLYKISQYAQKLLKMITNCKTGKEVI